MPVIGSGMAGRLTYRQFCEGGADPGAASLSPTPGGIGVVEVAMVAALAAVGVKGPRHYGCTGLPGNFPQGCCQSLGRPVPPTPSSSATRGHSPLPRRLNQTN